MGKKKKKLIDKIKVGDKLWSIPHGWVRMVQKNKNKYPIVTKNRCGEWFYFTDSGKHYEDKHKSLFRHKMRVVRAGKSDLSNAKVGDKVECVINGKGVIVQVFFGFMVKVRFKDGEVRTYYKDGRYFESDKHPSLYLLEK